MSEPELLNAFGVVRRPGQHVVLDVAGIHATGELTPGTIMKLQLVRRRDGSLAERIEIQREDGRRCALGWSKRVLVLRQPTEAEDWLRRQLEGLKR